jgi:hypothetical protein
VNKTCDLVDQRQLDGWMKKAGGLKRVGQLDGWSQKTGGLKCVAFYQTDANAWPPTRLKGSGHRLSM